MTGAYALQARGVRAHLGRREVLHGLDLAFHPGTWTSIVGPNGAGKSTLLRALCGLIPSQGEVLLDGRPLAHWPGRERARRMAWLAQGGAAETGADDLACIDVVMLGRLPHQRWLAAPSASDQLAVERAMLRTRCWEWREQPFGQLSGGERQRVLLARALAVQAPTLLMDEPLANLDPPHQADCLALARELVNAGQTVVTVLHELHAALAADQVLILAKGRVQHMGPSADPDTHRALEAVFDHRVRVHALEGRWTALPC